jgi:hypothetical protein
MANCGIVIGINQYNWAGSVSIKGAISEALQMRNWLLDKNGGNVPTHNLFLLLSPSKIDEVPNDLEFLTATYSNILDAIIRLRKLSNGKDERLFFYYSGIVIRKRDNFYDEVCITSADFSELHANLSFTLRSVLEYLREFAFHEQFFFIDGYRNISSKFDFPTPVMPFVPVRQRPSLTPNQFSFYTTSFEAKATEIKTANIDIRRFTQVLLEGLRGKAKVWDPFTQKYVVNVNNLFDFIKNEMSNRRVLEENVDNRYPSPLPVLYAQVGTSNPNPILTTFSPDQKT